MNSATREKREELVTYIQQVIVPETAVQGIVVIGSVAKGLARPDSDIDAVIFLKPYDLFAVPAEFKWQPAHHTMHSIFDHVEHAIQLDFKRFDLVQWSQPNFVWPESLCAEMGEGWVAFDRTGQIKPFVAERTAYSDEIRQSRLDESFVQLAQILDPEKAERTWTTLGATFAHGRLLAAYDFLVQGLFAYNCRWRSLRSRELSHLCQLSWLPEGFAAQLLLAANALSETQDGYQQRLAVLRHGFDELMIQCQHDGLYGEDVLNEAFVRLHDEPGRSWNMDEWNLQHQAH